MTVTGLDGGCVMRATSCRPFDLGFGISDFGLKRLDGPNSGCELRDTGYRLCVTGSGLRVAGCVLMEEIITILSRTRTALLLSY